MIVCRCGRGSYPIIRGVSNIIKGKKVCKKVSEENGQLTTPSPSVTEIPEVETVSEYYQFLGTTINIFPPRHPQATVVV